MKEVLFLDIFEVLYLFQKFDFFFDIVYVFASFSTLGWYVDCLQIQI